MGVWVDFNYEEAIADGQKYLNNIFENNKIDKTVYPLELTEDELISRLIDNAHRKRAIQVENNAFIDKYIVPLEKGVYEVDANVYEFLYRMSVILRDTSTNQYFDRGLNIRIIRLRRNYHQVMGNTIQFIHASFLMRYFSMFYSEQSGNRIPIECDEMLEDFPESYLTMETISTCYSFFDFMFGTVYNLTSPQNALKRLQKAIEYAEKYHKISLDPNYGLYSSYQSALFDGAYNFIIAYKKMPEFFGEEDLRFARKIERLISKEIDRLYVKGQYENAIITLYELRYIVGIYSIDELLEKLMELFSEDPAEGSIDKVMQLYKVAAQFIEDLWLFSPIDRFSKYEICKELHQRVIRGTETVEKTCDSSYEVLNRCDYITNGAKYIGFERTRERVLKAIVYADKPLYIHTRMVRLISLIITDAILNTDPDYFDGVADYTGGFAKKHPSVIKELMSQCALFHDIGKYFCLDFVSNSSRNLTDDEFAVIKFHPENFDCFFNEAEEDEEFQCIRDCARLHHLWHNGKGGYPLNLSQTKNRAMVDIISIADCIDAVTDVIGRPYTSGKTLTDLIEEYDSFRDTRYSGYVIDVLKRPDVKRKIEYAITVDRRHINYEIMRG